MFSPSQVLPFLDIVTNEVVTEVRREDTTDDADTIAYNTKMYNKAGSSHVKFMQYCMLTNNRSWTVLIPP